MESKTKDLGRAAPPRSAAGPPPVEPDETLFPRIPSGENRESWSRPATAQNEIHPAPPPPGRRANPLLPLAVVALMLALALLALAFSLQT